MVTKKLNGKQIRRLTGVESKLNELIGELQGLANIAMTNAITEAAVELGLDLKKEDWKFDAEEYTFTKQEDPKKTIPSDKKSKKA